MLKKEAGIISQELKLILKKRNFLKCLDIGSSTFEFRTKIQPFIQREIFMPLENRGIKIFHLDKKEDRGVDIVSKIEDIDRIRKKFDLILMREFHPLARNIIENPPPAQIVKEYYAILNEGGLIIIEHALPEKIWRGSENVLKISKISLKKSYPPR